MKTAGQQVAKMAAVKVAVMVEYKVVMMAAKLAEQMVVAGSAATKALIKAAKMAV